MKLLESEGGVASGGSAALTAEFRQLVDAGAVKEQNECLHTSPDSAREQGQGRWSYAAVFGLHSTVPAIDEPGGCNAATPLACALAAKLQAIPSIRLVRLGFSAVDPQTHIRPHWGPTNTQLKAHLGLVVPRSADGARCASLRVGGEERGWEVGRAALFDDSFLHEVWNNCSSQRLVLQAVFAHPDLVARQAGRRGGGEL